MSENLSVLLVEDNLDDALIMQKLLSRCGKPDLELVTQHSEDLKTAMQKLKNERYQLIVTDLNLPDSQGLNTFLRIRELQPATPIVICSTLEDQTITLEAIRKGAQDYIVKGQVNHRDLERIIRFALERRKVQDMKDEFIGMIVHDLRNPLTCVQMCTNFLSDGGFGVLNEEQKNFVTLATENCKRMVQLVDGILELKKIEFGKLSLKRKEVDLVELTRRLAEGMRFVVQNKGLEFRLNLPATPIKIWMDAEKIEKVWMNLISNAAKFTAAGFVEISIKDNKNEVICSVSDSGRGIKREDLNDLFSTFQKMDHFGTAGEKGTGLGLAIIKGIVTAHQGDIEVQSELNKGSKFIFTIPKVASQKS